MLATRVNSTRHPSGDLLQYESVQSTLYFRMNQYVYNKLDPQRREIRLCTLQPGSGDNPVNCTLTTVSLDGKPRYEAISYVWGDASTRQEIIVDSKSLLVTVNLHTALRYLRWKDRPRVLWADAICINQQNIDERSSQVSFMDNVYREAVEVQVWLCEEKEVIPKKPLDPSNLPLKPLDARRFNGYLKDAGFSRPQPSLISMSHDSMEPTVVAALAILRLFTERRHFHEMPFFYITPSLEVELSPKWHEILHIISLIISSPWWKRVWVVQEVVVAANSTVHIGVHQAPLSLFTEAADSYYGRHIESSHTTDNFMIWWYRQSTLINTLSASFMNVRTLALIKRLYNEGSLSSESVIEVSQFREASDPRDRVYASIGLSCGQGNVLDIAPDYEVSVSELYANVTQMLFRDQRSLLMLKLTVGVRENPLALPSWAMDLTSLSSSKSLLRRRFNASGSKAHEPLGERGLFLTIQGIEIDFVSEFTTLKVDVSTYKTLVRGVKQWQDFALHAQIQDGRTFWRTVFGDNVDLFQTNRSISSKEYDLIEEWWQRINEIVNDPTSATMAGMVEELNANIRRISVIARITLRRTVPYITSKGSLGSAPPAVREGDKIFIAKGSGAPLILRPVEELPGWNTTSADTLRPYYRLVGLCYLDGVMEGEAVHEDVVWEQIRLL